MTKLHTVKPLNLRFFDGDGAAAAVSGEAGMSETNNADNAQSANGGTKDTQDAAAGQQVVDDLDKRRAEFDAYINGDGKEFFDEVVNAKAKEKAQKAFNKRFAQNKALEAEAKDIEPLRQALAYKYGIDAKDTKAIVEAYLNDESYLEDKARENGVTIEVQRKFDQIERQNQELLAQQEEQRKQEEIANLQRGWDEQSAELAKDVEDFDFYKAIENPEFYDLVARGWNVKDAYRAAFPEEYNKMIVAKAEKRITDNIRSRGMRPSENGTSQTTTPNKKIDTNKLSLEQINEYAKRMAQGEKFDFA